MRLASKFFWFALAILSGVELLSLLAFDSPLAETAATVVATAAVLLAATYHLRWGVYAILTELFIGGKGYLLTLPLPSGRLSIRMILFIVVWGVWLGKFLTSRERHRHLPRKVTLLPTMLGAAMLAALLLGLARYPFGDVFFDANGWAFFLMAPVVFLTIKTHRDVQRVIQLLGAAVTVEAVKTGVLVYLFGHVNAALLEPTYRWIRDTGVGEVTYISGTLFRVFFQSHLYALVAWLTLLTILVSRRLQSKGDVLLATAVMYLASLTVIISQSRSFWIGGMAGFCFLLWIAHNRFGVPLGRTLLVAFLLVLIVQSQRSVVALISGNFRGGAFASRWVSLQDEPASSSRLSQLKPLISAIQQHPWLGSGYGRSVTYQSQDPRVVSGHPGGWYTTTAFEWGYLDMALKIGLPGLAFYLAWVASVMRQGLAAHPPPDGGNHLRLAAVVSLTGVLVTNIFSPYLNHPLGIGWVLFAVAAVYAVNSAADPKREPINAG